jgi:hypothetical protein
VGDGHHDFEIIGELPTHGLVVLLLEEALARRRFLQLGVRRDAHELVVPVRQAKHPPQDTQLAIDRAVGSLRRLALGHVGSHVSAGDRRQPPAGEERGQVRQPALGLAEFPLARRLVVRQQIVARSS